MEEKYDMTSEQAIRILKEHQKWRQGETDIMACTPKMLTEVIDTVLEEVAILKIIKNEQRKDIEILKAENEKLRFKKTKL